MRTKVFLLVAAMCFFIIPFTLCGQVKATFKQVENQELFDFFRLEKIEYINLSITGDELKNKSYHMSVKEIWDGEIKLETDIVDSKRLPFGKTLSDTILNIRIISKLTNEDKLKMDFHFPTFSTQRNFDATSSNIYSLRSAMATDTIEIGKKSYLLVYMLPYETVIENVGVMRQYCAVENSGKEIETWGKEFGIKHYLVFEIKFDTQ